MLKQTSKNFRQFFFLEFTKELIRSTATYREFKIKKEVKEVIHEKPIVEKFQQKDLFKREILRGAVKEKIKRDFETVSQLKTEKILPEFKKYAFRKPINLLQIPEPKLPETVRYLKPIRTSKTIDLGKLNPLMGDPLVRVIKCNGPNEKVIVLGAMGEKNTKIILTKEEINDIMRRFSDAAKIPIHAGVFRVVFGTLILSAIVSEIIGSKFLIKKMSGPGFV